MWEELYEEHFRELVAYGSRMCENRELAQDLAQETFIKAQMNGETLESLPPNKRRAWLYRTLKPAHRLLPPVGPGGSICAEHAATVFESSGLQNVENELFLHAVSPQDRTIFLLRYYEGYTAKEISEMLHLPAGTVRSRLHRCRKHLK